MQHGKRWLISLVLAACAHHAAALGQAQTAFEQNRYTQAKEILADNDTEILDGPVEDRARYAYLRGMTLYYLEEYAVADSWLEEAQKLEKEHPGLLTAEHAQQVAKARIRMDAARRELDARYASRANRVTPTYTPPPTSDDETSMTADDAPAAPPRRPARPAPEDDSTEAPKGTSSTAAVTAPGDAPQHDAATLSTEKCRGSRADYHIQNESPNGGGAGRSGWRVQWAGAGIAGIGGFVSIWTNWNLCNTHPLDGSGEVALDSVIWRVRNDTASAKQVCFTSDVSASGVGFHDQETGPHCTAVLAPGEESYSLGPTASFSCRDAKHSTPNEAQTLVPTVTIYECNP